MLKSLSILLCCLLAAPARADDFQQPALSHHLTALSAPRPAPDFALVDMDKKKFSLKDYRGKVVLLNFWATWCPPCRREMPSMQRLHQALQGKDFVVLALNQMEDEDKVFTFSGDLGIDLTFPILFDRDSGVANTYEVHGLPTSYLIDKQGRIRFRAIGGRNFDHAEVKKVIRQLMQE